MSRRTTIGDSGGPTPEALMKVSCQAGGQKGRKAFAKLVNLFGGSVRRLVVARVGPDRDVVLDTEQEIWTKIWKTRCLFRGEHKGDARKWIMAIARNVCADVVEWMVREREFRSDEDVDDETAQALGASWEPQHIERSAVDAAMLRLRAEDPAAALLLHAKYVEGWTWDRIIREFPFDNKYQARKAVVSATRAFKRLYDQGA
ncbi:MAG TPA: hypothetical protein VG318_14015 [Actinomycetota bacterium]|nr:hypothetical protein [Actinomycetota bacterium]